MITPDPAPRPARGRVTHPAAAALQATRAELDAFLLTHPLRPTIEQAAPFRSTDEWAATERFFTWSAQVRNPALMERCTQSGAVRSYWPPIETHDAMPILGQCAMQIGRPALDRAVDCYANLIALIADQITAARDEVEAIAANVDALTLQDADLCVALEVATYLGYRARQLESIAADPASFWEARDLREEAGQRLPPVLTDEESSRHLAYLMTDYTGATRACHDTLVGELLPYLERVPGRGIIETLADAYARRGREPYWGQWREPAIRVFGTERTLGELAQA